MLRLYGYKKVDDLSSLSEDAAKSLRFLLTDIDDTLTDEGRLPLNAYTALWKLKEAGLIIIPVTGRPAGWCECIVRHWPVDGIIGENGAFAYYMDGPVLKRMYHPSVPREDRGEKFSAIQEAVLQAVPKARIAKDQYCRMFDLAIDFAEEPPRLSLSDARRIRDICESFGAHAKVSSIHVNTWFGDYDKLDMSLLFLHKRWAMDDSDVKKHACFCGDSPNDEPMFAFFPISFAVANIDLFADDMDDKPAFRASRKSGKGFFEIAEKLLFLRKK